ncbi:MAG TPA: hypothetical protein ENI27_02070, partial [bacterium]|nr:hypothetical protein [bacterium]
MRRETRNYWPSVTGIGRARLPRKIMLDMKGRGLEEGPKLAIGDGALGFWAALREVFPGPNTREQRCWFHKSGNILDKFPKSMQSKAREMVREMWQAPT